MSNCFQIQAEWLWVCLKQCRKEQFGRLVRQPQGARADSAQVGTTLSNILFYAISLSSRSFLPIPWRVFLAGCSSSVAFDIPSLQAWWLAGEMAGNLLLGTFVLLLVFFLPQFLCYRWASVSLGFVSFSCSFLRQNKTAAISEPFSETSQVRGPSTESELQRGSSSSLCLYNTVHLLTISGETNLFSWTNPLWDRYKGPAWQVHFQH